MKPAVVLFSTAALLLAVFSADAAAKPPTWAQTSMTFTLASDPQATSSLCWTDVKPTWRPCSSPVVYPNGTFQVGRHEFRVKSVSPDGVSDPSSYVWTVVAPFIPPGPTPVPDPCRTPSPNGCGHAFPSAWVARLSTELGATCQGVRRVVMVAPPGGYGYKTIVCQKAGTTFTYTINAKGHVQAAAVS